MKKSFTIGYGGRTPEELLECLATHGVQAVVDVRLSPRGHMGLFTRAASSDKGIQGLLGGRGIGYFWIRELGNPFRGEKEWRERYRAHLETQGEAAFRLLEVVPEPYCLLCAEKRIADCHRLVIAERLSTRGCEFEHL